MQGTQSIGSLSSGDLEDPDFSKEQDLELKCARAFKAVLHFEQTHCLQVEVRCRRCPACTASSTQRNAGKLWHAIPNGLAQSDCALCWAVGRRLMLRLSRQLSIEHSAVDSKPEATLAESRKRSSGPSTQFVFMRRPHSSECQLSSTDVH